MLEEICGTSLKDCVAPVCKCISVGVALQDLTSIGNLKSPSKVVKIDVMSESLNAVDGIEYGSTQAVAKTFNISYKAAKCPIYDTADGKTKAKMAGRKKRMYFTQNGQKSL